jgi:hypothetical protein
MPGLYAQRELFRDPAVRTFEFSDRKLYRTIGMAWRKTSSQAQTYVKLAEFFKKMAEELTERRR